jgi:hypothetical protein
VGKIMRNNIHDWNSLFVGDTCRICYDQIKTGTGKCNHALKHVREGKAVRSGDGTQNNPFSYSVIQK